MAQRRVGVLSTHVAPAAASAGARGAAAPATPWEELLRAGPSAAASDAERLQAMARADPPRAAESTTAFRTVLYSKAGGVCVISQSRPHVLNARNAQMYYDLIAAFEEAERDDDVVAVVFTGEGRYMCSGADTTGGAKKGPRDALPDPPRVRELKAVRWRAADSSTWPAVRMVNKFINCSKPLVAAVNGPVVGEGCSSLLHADVVYAADTATFWLPFHRIAAVPEFCASALLPLRVGANVANEMVLMSAKKSAAELRAAGLVSEILPAGAGFLPAVLDRVRAGVELAGAPTTRGRSMRLFKGVMKTQEERGRLMLLNQSEQEVAGRRGAEAGEANAAFYASQMPTKAGQRKGGG